MFNINAHCVLFGVNEHLNKRAILSTSQEEIIFPVLSFDESSILKINESIIAFLKNYIFVSDLILIPQIINLNSSTLNQNSTTLEMVFGFIVDYNSSIDPSKAFWIDFDPMKECKLSPIIFETIQKLI